MDNVGLREFLVTEVNSSDKRLHPKARYNLALKWGQEYASPCQWLLE